MKSIQKLGIAIIILSFSFQPVSAQSLLKRIQRHAENKVEERAAESANKQVDKKIDEAFDKLDESLENGSDSAYTSGKSHSRTDEERMSSIMKGLGMSGEPVPYDDKYTFDNMIQIHVENYDKSGKQEDAGDIALHFTPNSKSMAYEVISGDIAKDGQGMFIIDAENGAMIMLNNENGEKSGIVYEIGRAHV